MPPGGRVGLNERDPGDDPNPGLKTGQSVGVAIGIVFVLSLMLFLCCYLKCVISFFRSQPRNQSKTVSGNRRSSYHKDPQLERYQSEVHNYHHHQQQQRHVANEIITRLARNPSTASSTQLYIDGKIELPVPDGLRHEIDGVGRSAATAPNRIEIDSTPLGPVELPAEPAVTRQSWSTSATTLFQYTPRPSYILSEDEEDGKEPDVVSPLSPVSPTTYQRWEVRSSNGSNMELPPTTQLAPRPLSNLSNVVEAQHDWCDTTKEVLPPQQEEDMLRRNRWSAWRNWGGGAGGNGTL